MKKLLPAIISLLFLSSCKSSKDYLAHRNEDKTLFEIVKQLNKHPNDELAVNALPEVYSQLQQTHLGNIAIYEQENSLSRWDKLINEYNILQSLHDAVVNSSTAANLVTPVNYQQQVSAVRNNAAEDFYQAGIQYLAGGDWQNARKAYQAFRKSSAWVTGYKDVDKKNDTALQNSIITVLINPVQDNSLFFNTGWSSSAVDFDGEQLPENMVNDLGGNSAGKYPAQFYTGWQAERSGINPDWIVDLTLRNIDIPRPTVYNYSRSVSKKIEDGKDSLGKFMYKTVYATLHIQRQSFRAQATLDMNITESATRKNQDFESFSDTYNWQQEVASYSGDNRALGNNDWALVNSRFNLPSKATVLGELYRDIYPQVRNSVGRSVDW